MNANAPLLRLDLHSTQCLLLLAFMKIWSTDGQSSVGHLLTITVASVAYIIGWFDLVDELYAAAESLSFG